MGLRNHTQFSRVHGILNPQRDLWPPKADWHFFGSIVLLCSGVLLCSIFFFLKKECEEPYLGPLIFNLSIRRLVLILEHLKECF